MPPDIQEKEIKIMKKEKNEYWLDELLDRPENQQKQQDGSILYGSVDEPKFWSQEYWLDVKNGWVMLWQAKNPFNDHRSVMKSCLLLMHPDLYRLFFPFSYIGHMIGNLFSGNADLRKQTLEDSVLVTLIIEMSVMFVIALIVIGIYLLWANVVSPLFQ